MFLTKKSIVKIAILAFCTLLLGTACVVLTFVLEDIGLDAPALLSLGVAAYGLSILSVFWGSYAEGKGKLINLGNQLVFKELRPADFVNQYNFIRNGKDLVVAKPSFEVLQLVAVAYEVLDDPDNLFETVNTLICLAKEKKRPYANLFKASELYQYGKIEEAEALFYEAQTHKLNALDKAFVDAIMKTDRAMAMGDYKTAEVRCLEILDSKYMQNNKLALLQAHDGLGQIYEKLQDNEKAILHYQYCLVNGGETAIRKKAAKKLEELKTAV